MTSDASPVGVPVCYRHSGRETYVRCTRCNRSICPDCMREASVGHQCPDCVAATGEYYRLFTAMFMHYGAIHLLMNMWALWILGRTLETMFGPVRFLAVYLVCGLGGSVSSYIFQPKGLTACASGAIFGLFAVLFVALRRLRLSTSAVLPVIIINLIFTISVPGISIAGHIGGLITGGLVGAGVAYAPRANRNLVQVGVLVGAVVLLGLLAVWQTAHLTAAERA